MPPDASVHPSVVPVILAGGEGRRLRPWSKTTCPKPFLQARGRSLLQHTLERMKGSSPLIVCAQDCRQYAHQQAGAVIPDYHLLLEPCVRNTAPAIAVAAAYIVHHQCGQSWMLVMPSDHAMDNPERLRGMVNDAVASRSPGILSFGVRPRGPSSRFGYILADKKGVRFHEKPDRRTARDLIAAGACWNSGIWLAQAAEVRKILIELAPGLWRLAEQSVTYARHQERETTLEPSYFERIPSASVDRMLMEKTEHITCHILEARWRDLGSWPAMTAYLCGF